MTELSGNIRKMHTEAPREGDILRPRYLLPVGEAHLPLSDHIGSRVHLGFDGTINCVACGRVTKKSFNQGYCYPCVRNLAECDICIVSPEKCHYEAGTCRDPDWADDHCMQSHIVYLSNTSGVKVGITRHTQVPTRWIDQGAAQALPVFRVRSRHQSGLIEQAFKAHISDRTDWRRMLRGEPEAVDLVARRDALVDLCAGKIEALRERFGPASIETLDAEPVKLEFPVSSYPEKVTSLNLDKTPEISGTLLGIKGQYLILDSGVLNIRKFGGYRLDVAVA